MTETDCHREIMNRKRMSYIPAVHRTQGFYDFVAHFFQRMEHVNLHQI